ncbi:hypothetical protein JCM11251_002429 [Rhodosporidiobolus azoricus]
MFRIKDKDVSLKFYTEVLGMELIHEMCGGDFSNYFVAFPEPGMENASKEERAARRLKREGVIELCHNHGTESDPNFKGYASGNDEPGRGFGHIAISCEDVDKECERLDALGVKFKKRPSEGRMRHIAFIYDPDGYWIELVPQSGNGA